MSDSRDVGATLGTRNLAARRIEFIGDSLPNGSGSEGEYLCTSSTWTHNAIVAYAGRAADMLGKSFDSEQLVSCPLAHSLC